MTEDPETIRDDCAALDALDRMVEHGIRHLPVVDAVGALIGVSSIDDLRAALPFEVGRKTSATPSERREALDYRVSDAMSWAPVTIGVDDSLEEAARRLAEHRFGCLPVVDDADRLVGIITETDALRALDALLRNATRKPAPVSPHGEAGLVETLWSERERLVDQLAKWKVAERSLSTDPRDEPIDPSERASDQRNLAELDAVRAVASRRLAAIERALERADRHQFGICEQCQRHIPATRLRAMPEATLCVRCARVTARASGAI